MKSIINIADEPSEVIINYPDDFKSENELDEKLITIAGKWGESKTLSAFINGAHLEQRQVQVAKNGYFMDVRHDFPLLKMQFELQGHSLYKPAFGEHTRVEITAGTHRLFFLPEVEGRLFYPKNRLTLEIKLTVSFLRRMFDDDLRSLNDFGKQINRNQPVLLTPKSLPITPEMKHVVSAINNCPYRGTMKKIFLECKVKELLLLQLEQAQKTDDKSSMSKAQRLETEKLHFVKELITGNIQKPYTIPELSHLAGMNDFKLKSQFKQLFGNTLFGYLTFIRLQQAHQMIKEGTHNIQEASYLVGYKHPQHFSNAFKKQYGYLPSAIR